MEKKSLVDSVKICCNNKLLPILYVTTTISGFNLFFANPNKYRLLSLLVFMPSLIASSYLTIKEKREYEYIEDLYGDREFKDFYIFKKNNFKRQARFYAKKSGRSDEFKAYLEKYNLQKAANSN